MANPEEKDPFLRDAHGRALSDLRLSVTDRCNFRCRYCLPREQVQGTEFLPRSSILSYEEMTRVARAAVSLGVRKIRLTGGEPLLRKDLPVLVEQLSELGVELALTTNGVLLPGLAGALFRAGLHRVTVSLDSLSEETFQRVADAPGFQVRDVLRGIDAAEEAGFSSIKINTVVLRGKNEAEIPALVRHFRGRAPTLRFIEFMDVGTKNAWEATSVVSKAEILRLLEEVGDFVPEARETPQAPATMFRCLESGQRLGVIASVTEPFCGDCSRLRLSADGHLYTCLFSGMGTSIREEAQSESDDSAVREKLIAVWRGRTDRYSQERGNVRRLPLVSSRVEMAFIGG